MRGCYHFNLKQVCTLMNLVEFEENALKYEWKSYNLSISKKTMKINNTSAFFKVKILFWNKITCRVFIKIKIILNGCVVMIIEGKNILLFQLVLSNSHQTNGEFMRFSWYFCWFTEHFEHKYRKNYMCDWYDWKCVW